MSAIETGTRGGIRLGLVRLHRLAEFVRVLSLYLDGRAEGSEVVDRAKKMIAIGLPQRMGGAMAWALVKAVTIKWGLN